MWRKYEASLSQSHFVNDPDIPNRFSHIFQVNECTYVRRPLCDRSNDKKEVLRYIIVLPCRRSSFPTVLRRIKVEGHGRELR